MNQSWTKSLPGRSHLRPLKQKLMRPGLARTLRRRKWDKKWRTRDGFAWAARGVPPELEAAVTTGRLVPGSHVLDLGCGDGSNAAWLAGQGFSVHGVDFSAAAIDKARANHRYPGLTFDTVDVSVVGALGSRQFDALVDRGCLHCLPPQLKPMYAANVARWVVPGGTLLLTVIGGRGAAPIRRAEVEALLGDVFEVESAERVEGLVKRERKDLDGICFALRRRTGGSSG